MSFIFSAFCCTSFVVQKAKSALVCLDSPNSSQTTLFTAYKFKLSAIGAKKSLAHFSVKFPIKAFLLCKAFPSALSPLGA